MTVNEILTILKTDLKISVNNYDEYLQKCIEAAAAAIETEGIVLKNNIEDGMLTELYAAHLYRKRHEEESGIPKHLRRMLNNRLFKEKVNGGV